MQYGIHNENGIDLCYSNVLSYDSCDSELPNEIQTLDRYRNRLNDYIQDEVLEERILGIFKDLASLLKNSVYDQSTLRTSFYSGLPALQKSQEILLSLANTILEVIDTLRAPITIQLSYKVLKRIIVRRELSITASKHPMYFPILCKALDKALQMPVSAKDYTCSLLTLGYFVFPVLRHEILQIFSTNTQVCKIHKDKHCILIEKLFSHSYSRVPDIVHKKAWKDKLKTQPGLSLHFIFTWMRYTEKLLAGSGNIPWESIEGYTTLTSIILSKLQKTSVVHYSEQLKDVTEVLLTNQQLLSTMLHIVLSKCSPYDIKTVDATLELVVWWIRVLISKKKQPFDPEYFDFEFFGKAVGRMLEMEGLFTSYKCLWMLYNILHYIPRKYEVTKQNVQIKKR
eukprot:TRINITY_DN135116_c0_g1_i1.p1 TRINITY_DN135116_c0_g1~~TRINITY_DN135116_c0_g1_i1.p1  ORF type:complete len:397 (+),score=24.11 TRINITY_DN135116_c0_g1_i1:1398-2588(+)